MCLINMWHGLDFRFFRRVVLPVNHKRYNITYEMKQHVKDSINRIFVLIWISISMPTCTWTLCICMGSKKFACIFCTKNVVSYFSDRLINQTFSHSLEFFIFINSDFYIFNFNKLYLTSSWEIATHFFMRSIFMMRCYLMWIYKMLGLV